MSNNKHTPGPWFYNSDTGHITDSHGDRVISGDREGGLSGRPHDIAIAIVSPELLEALDRLEVSANTVSFCYDRNPGNFAIALQQLQEDAKLARAAIARATGGAA